MSRHQEADSGRPPASVTIGHVEAELARHSVLDLTFRPLLETCYEVETQVARAWHIRLTLTIGLVAYDVFALVDRLIVADLGWVPTVWRLGIISPVGLLAIWKCTRVTAKFREACLTFMMMWAIAGPIGFMLLSRAPLASHMLLCSVLISMFGNITVRLRFHWAGLFTLVTLILVWGMLWLKPDLPPGLGLHCFLVIGVCACFGLVANNQLERAERRSFLLTLRETLRSEQLRADKASLSVLSHVDALTGLANRRAFDSRLAELWRRSHDGSDAFSLLMIDVDFFKPYNDHYGHPAGDACLARIGALLREVVFRDQDVVARYGGEEFAVLLSGADGPEAARIAERLRMAIHNAAIGHRFRGDGDQIVSVSIGLATCDRDHPASSAALLSIADQHLYEAKRAGRNQVCPKIGQDAPLASVA